MKDNHRRIFDLPDNIGRTRNAKFNAKRDLNFLARSVRQMEDYIDRIPEEDNSKHAALVEELAHKIHRALLEFDEAEKVGKI